MKALNLRDGPAAYLLRGNVMHERLRPAHHAFDYPLFQIVCDIGRLDESKRWWFGVERWRPMSISSRDYGPRDGSALEPWMRARLAEAGIPADGRIWLQTIPRLAGYAFNPVSFWYCHDRHGDLRALYADVRNTFGEHHGYLLSAPGHFAILNGTVLQCRKVFHVSPFCDVEGHYEFRARRYKQNLSVAIDYFDRDEVLLRTALSMQAEPFTGRSALRAVMALPFNAINVVLRIHWQALRLLRKRVPFYGKTPPTQVATTCVAHADAPKQQASPSDQEVIP